MTSRERFEAYWDAWVDNNIGFVENSIKKHSAWEAWQAAEAETAQRIAELEAELGRERMRLATCGVVALANTPESAKQARQMHADYHSASCDDVARLVDECMALRAECAALKALLIEVSVGHRTEADWDETIRRIDAALAAKGE